MARNGLMYAPEKIACQLLGGRLFEIRGFDPGRWNEFQHTFAGAVLATGVHALKEENDRVFPIGVEELLEFANAHAELDRFFAGFFLVQSRVVGGIKIAKLDFGRDFEWLSHAKDIDIQFNNAGRMGSFTNVEKVWTRAG